MTLSIVIPVYNEAENVPILYGRIFRILKELNEAYEILFVDDGSTDRSLEVLKSLRANGAQVAILSLARNFGHQAALTAGLEHARGRAVICMDADLQHPPERIPEMVRAWRDGNAVVHMVKAGNAGTSWWRRRIYGAAYAMLRWLSRDTIVPHASDFYLLDRRVVDLLRHLPERARFTRGLIHWFGLPTRIIAFTADDRRHGVTKYSTRKLCSLLLDGVTSFSGFPLRVASFTGFFVSLTGFVYAAYLVAVRLMEGTQVSGWTTVVVLVLVLGGMQLLALGVIGEYLGRVYGEVKGRPVYIVREAIGIAADA